MAQRPWLQAILKVVVMASTMCGGVIVAKCDVPIGDEGYEGGKGTQRPQQDLDRAARRIFTMNWKDKAGRLLGNRTIYLEGDGQFAFVTPCRDRAFSLWATRAEAEQAMKSIMPCGGDCQGMTSHYIADLGEGS